MYTDILSSNEPLSINHPLISNWHQSGYLVLKNVLNQEEIQALQSAVDSVTEQYLAKKFPDLSSHKLNEEMPYLNIKFALQYSEAFDYLMDHPKTFPLITHLLGPYLQVMGLDVFIRHRTPISNDSNKIHTDGGIAFQQMLPTSNILPLQFKIQFFLTDVDHEDCGNFALIPNSHIKAVIHNHPMCQIPEYQGYGEQGCLPPEAIQLKLKAGDALIHIWSLWHAVAPNKSDQVRKSICLRYGQMWLKPYYHTIPENVLLRMTARQKRLLCDFGTNPKVDAPYRPPHDQLELMLHS